MYGLRQAPLEWCRYLTEALGVLGLCPCGVDRVLRTSKKQDGLVHILMWVDDLLLAGEPDQLVAQAKEPVLKRFRVGSWALQRATWASRSSGTWRSGW